MKVRLTCKLFNVSSRASGGGGLAGTAHKTGRATTNGDTLHETAHAPISFCFSLKSSASASWFSSTQSRVSCTAFSIVSFSSALVKVHGGATRSERERERSAPRQTRARNAARKGGVCHPIQVCPCHSPQLVGQALLVVLQHVLEVVAVALQTVAAVNAVLDLLVLLKTRVGKYKGPAQPRQPQG